MSKTPKSFQEKMRQFWCLCGDFGSDFPVLGNWKCWFVFWRGLIHSFERSGPWMGPIIPFTDAVLMERDEFGSQNFYQGVEFPLE